MGSHHADLTYDSDFRPSTQTIDGSSSITFGYDLEGLLTGAGLETLHRPTTNGMLDSTTFATGFNAWSSQDYNGVGELANLRYRWHGCSDPYFVRHISA